MSTQKAATELEMIIFVFNDDSGTVVDLGEVGIDGCTDDVIIVAVTVPVQSQFHLFVLQGYISIQKQLSPGTTPAVTDH